jgi:ABC-type transporter Mla subunit MlaD
MPAERDAQAAVPGTITTLDDAIDHLAESLQQLAAFAREHQDELKVYELARVCAVRGQNLSRFARMLRERAVQAGELDGELAAQIDEALELAGEALETEV